jgi:Icc-related predicted phosphoesterase
VRLLAFSDLHRDLDRARSLVERSRDADAVAAVGDLASVHRGLDAMIGVLRAIRTPTVLVPGNNETEEALRSACAGWDVATVLHGETVDVAGATFFGLGAGVPETPWDWSFDLNEHDAAAKLATMPEGAIFVVHSPPKGHVDGGLGSAAILDAIERTRPRIALCGHIHECWGQESRVGDTRVLNLGPDGVLLDL